MRAHKDRDRLLNKQFDLADVLPEVLQAYNYEAKNSAHGMTPAEAFKKENEDKVRKIFKLRYDEYTPRNGPEFEVGDIVRISKIKRTFEKGTTAGWTEELFRVTEVHETKPVTYSIVDMKGEAVEGKFYAWEMRKTAA